MEREKERTEWEVLRFHRRAAGVDEAVLLIRVSVHLPEGRRGFWAPLQSPPPPGWSLPPIGRLRRSLLV